MRIATIVIVLISSDASAACPANELGFQEKLINTQDFPSAQAVYDEVKALDKNCPITLVGPADDHRKSICVGLKQDGFTDVTAATESQLGFTFYPPGSTPVRPKCGEESS